VSHAEAYVSAGTNLGDRAAHLRHAVRSLGALPETSVAALSPIFETDPVGPPPQGPYLNAALRVATALAPRALLDALLAIERAAGRERGARNAARTLDLDLLLYGDLVIDEPGLVVPHPRLAERPFVLAPLAALAPDLVHPVLHETIGALAARVRDPVAVRRWAGDDAAFRTMLG
jgi:2-amino-4-hydroxy-6-hydroxymethyldihydropteridine diphosphokinase